MLCREEDPLLSEPTLSDGEVRSILDRWAHVEDDLRYAACCLRLQLGPSVADDTGDARGVYVFPETTPVVGSTYATALAWLEERAAGRWIQPMTEEQAKRYAGTPAPPPKRHRRP